MSVKKIQTFWAGCKLGRKQAKQQKTISKIVLKKSIFFVWDNIWDNNAKSGLRKQSFYDFDVSKKDYSKKKKLSFFGNGGSIRRSIFGKSLSYPLPWIFNRLHLCLGSIRGWKNRLRGG
jgi:hypothetical protein